MPHLTTCPGCADLYEESSEENANRNDRLCAECLLFKRAAAVKDPLLAVVERVADWNLRYPSAHIYSEDQIRRIAAEMDEINAAAIAALAPSAWTTAREIGELYAVIFRDGGHRYAALKLEPQREVDGYGMQPASLAAAVDEVLAGRSALEGALSMARGIADKFTRDEDAVDVDALVKLLEQATGQAAPAGEVCGNCETALPEGCGGIFKGDGEACALNRRATEGSPS